MRCRVQALEALFQHPARQALSVAGGLAHAPFPAECIAAALPNQTPDAVLNALKTLLRRGFLFRAGSDWHFAHVLAYQFARRELPLSDNWKTSVGRWLTASIEQQLGSPDWRHFRDSLENRLQHAGAMLRNDENMCLWSSLGQPLLYPLSDRFEDLGSLGLVALALDAVAGALAPLPPAMQSDPGWIHHQSVLWIDKGDLLSAQGDSKAALAIFRQAHDLVKPHSVADPENTDLQRDLSVSHDNVGNVLRDQGDLSGALEAYRKSLAVSQRLAEADPSNAGWQRDLSLSLTLLAQIHQKQTDLATALAYAQRSLAIDERLAALDPSNATWQRDVAVTRRLVDRLRSAPE